MRLNHFTQWAAGLAFVCLLVVSAALSPAAWIGDVADVAGAGEIKLVSTGATTYATLLDAYNAAVQNDTILVGPGTYALPASGVTTSYITNTKRVSISGSGSGDNPASSTVIDGGQIAGRFHHSRSAPTADPNTLVTLKDIRVNNMLGGCFYADDGLPNFVFENLALEAGDNPADNVSGAGIDCIGAGGLTSNVTIRNNLLFGNNGYGVRVPGGQPARDWLVEGNEFQSMQNGLILNNSNIIGLRVLNNVFKDMTEYARDDAFNPYGNAGIVMAPRGSSAIPGLIKDILIQGNTFKDNGYTGPEAGETDPHPWAGLDILGECGIQVVTWTYGTVENVMVRGNTFEDTGAGGTMKYGVFIKETDYSARDIAVPSRDRGDPPTNPPLAAPTGIQGFVKYFVVDGNTFSNLTTDLKGLTAGSGGLLSPVIYPVNLAAGPTTAGITLLGDSVGADRMITLADINGNTADVNRDGSVDAQDKADLVTKVLMTSLADTDLNKKVNIVDLGNLANRYDLAGQFQDGDTDLNGLINIVDLGNMANDYDKKYDLMPAVQGYIAVGGSDVPEPATMGLLGLLGLGMLRRRPTA